MITAKLQDISKYIVDLRRSAETSPEVSPSQVYLDSLNADALLLASFTVERVPRSQLKSGLDEVASDLALKVIFARTARGAPFELIEVVAHT
ncbi:MAG: hypothetical protein M3362_27190, partial [Acidobacteriota bacterium]|nr:hypothetical protein [Acidobacteriota bacterium]